MLYADDVGVVSQSPEQARKMMGVAVIACAAFDLIVSEAKTETMCLRSKEMSESTAIVSVEAAGQVYNHTNEFIYLGIIITHTQRMVQLREVHPRTDDRPSPPLELKSGC